MVTKSPSGKRLIVRSQGRKPLPPFETTRVFSLLVNIGFSYPFQTLELNYTDSHGVHSVYTFRTNLDANGTFNLAAAINKAGGYYNSDLIGGEIFNWLTVPSCFDKR